MSRNDQALIRPRLATVRRACDPAARRLLRAAEAAAGEHGVALWLVGGAVRDVALGRAVHDIDVAIDGDVERFARACAAALGDGGAATTVRSRFGTASVEAGNARLDAARLRTETYAQPGALPHVRATRSIERDLARRDFTVNAMALGLAGPQRGELVDPFGGMGDLTARRLRVLHPRSFEDDATRIWRGARTAALCNLRPDAGTAERIAAGAGWLDTISGERLWGELEAAARRGRAYGTLLRLDAWGALEAIHPALGFGDPARQALRHRPRPLPAVRLAAVLIAPTTDPRAVLARFAVDREARETVLDARRLLDTGGAGEPSPEALAALEGARDEARTAAHWLAPAPQQALQRALRGWERTQSPLDAAALHRLGIERGPAIGRTLRGLRRARYLGTLSTAAQARRAVRDGTIVGEGCER